MGPLHEAQCYKSVCLGQVYVLCIMCYVLLYFVKFQNRPSIERPKVTQEENSDTRGFLRLQESACSTPKKARETEKGGISCQIGERRVSNES